MGRTLIKEATGEVLQAYPSASAVSTVLPATNTDFVVGVCGESLSDDSRRDLMISLLTNGSGYYLSVIKGLLWQVWPQRYLETQGQSILFREPGNLAESIDYYCAHCWPDRTSAERNPCWSGS